MKKKGFTLLELMVAMTLFIIFTTVAIGAFFSITRLKALSMTMRESQQKLRITMEMVSRLTRQASEIKVPSSTEMDLYFDDNGERTGSRFFISGNTVYYQECKTFLSNYCNNDWETGTDLFGGKIQVNTGSGFVKNGTFPPTITVNFMASTPGGGSVFYNDNFNLTSTIVMENVK